MTKFQSSELSIIPHFDLTNIEGRYIPSLIFFTKGEWEFWVPTPDGKFIKSKAWPAESTYFGDSKENEFDITFHFLDFLSQRANYLDQAYALQCIEDDIFNLSSSLRKFQIFRDLKDDVPGRSRLVATELEYLFSVCRSMFDLLQEIIAKMWSRIVLLDGTKNRQMKSKFSDMVFESGNIRAIENYTEHFGLPPSLAEFYHRQAKFFIAIRSLRDAIIHRGRGIRLIFDIDNEFAVDIYANPFSDIYTWSSGEIIQNNLGKLMPMVNSVIRNTINACDDFTQTIEKVIGFPNRIAPGHQLIFRGYYNKELLSALV